LICVVSSHNGQYDISPGNLKLADFDGNGDNEVFFSIFSGFSLTPRKLYIYHPENKNLISSRDIGVKYTEISFFDLNGDGNLEILAGSYSSENYDTLSTIEFGDRKAGTFIYNSDLQILSEPIIFEENKPTVNLFPLERKRDTMVIAIVNETKCMNNSRILFVNMSMDILHEISVPQMSSPGLFSFQEKGQTLYYLSDEYSVFLLDYLKFNTSPVRLKGEIIDMVDGSRGIGSKYLLFSTPNTIALVNSKLRLASNKIAVPANFSVVEKVFDDYSGDMRYILYNDNFKKYYTLGFTYRKLYDYRYFLYLATLIFIYLVIFIIGSEIRVKSAMRRLIEQRSSILELQLMHTQLQPHFTFNILNTLGSMIYHDNKEEAYTYLHKFSSLLRMVLETDVDLKWTLKDEISFVEQYISLENERFQGKYNYEFIINDNVERNFLVPKMIMQVFVENALSHGLKTKQSDCYVVVAISLSESHLKIDIADNGIGRKKASSLKANRKGKSIVLINEFINSYNRNNKSKFRLRILDYQPEQSETGTRVEIDIPLEFCKHRK
ncbi:MAG: histidine kinase, partial [Bacteroidales bacterium]|nr:histidine kinase [Bacteroidales bacterium]